jgi:hypothetical protein
MSKERPEYMAEIENMNEQLEVGKIKRLPTFEEYFVGLDNQIDLGDLNDIDKVNKPMGASQMGNL